MEIVVLDRGEGKTNKAIEWLLGSRFHHLMVVNQAHKNNVANVLYQVLNKDKAAEVLKRVHIAGLEAHQLRGYNSQVTIGIDDVDYILRQALALPYPIDFLSLTLPKNLDAKVVTNAARDNQ
jgi:hypothetical protein